MRDSYRIGVDIGGTFTDVVVEDQKGSIRYFKTPTTRKDESQAVVAAVSRLIEEWGMEPRAITRFAHGTTVGTNAVLERKGSKIGLIATRGFRDVIEIGRQMRHDLYRAIVKEETPTFLAPREMRVDVTGRIGSKGEEVEALDEKQVVAAAADLLAGGAEVLAVSFLFSFVNPAHELAARAVIRKYFPDVTVVLSHEVDPVFREYERTVVTAFDAYVKPVIDRYLTRLENGLRDKGVEASLQVIQSRGGLTSSAHARQRPVRLFLSGPAAGVIGAQQVGKSAGIVDLITVDVGGTSSDIALIANGQALVRSEGYVDGYTIRVPMVDVNSIGSGGGSIAWIDKGGALRVGPQSAGSEPGPACYGRGGELPTVTDASVVLGYIDPTYFAGGALTLDPKLAYEAIRLNIAEPLGISVTAAALGIHRVVNAQMAEGTRLVSVKQGVDPRKFALLPLGGGGGIHAVSIAEELGMTRVLVPKNPGVLAAYGLLSAPIEHEFTQAVNENAADLSLDRIKAVLETLDTRCAHVMAEEPTEGRAAERRHYADVCYVGQSYTLEVPFDTGAPAPLKTMTEAFYAAHKRVYGHSYQGPLRIVNLRAIHSVVPPLPTYAGLLGSTTGGQVERRKTREIHVRNGNSALQAEIIHRESLSPGDVFDGPAILEQPDTTTLVPDGWQGNVDPVGNVILTFVKG
ncbi:hydantoinase/oxoprolinase family protein [Cupriavidus sp. SK-3]|uniref:hydantoinase/oxoprolinase family protein n=1 Tax=Cupriavidus sp. SK-3 TaxID=1470558 RepID=UPI000449EE26|nr:hydantoinase/oxoprolinase family protein [Cupriavidus sp. SK-3]KDP89474.1 hypothetical protein CF70_031230 [Cupriavidus sp. SK-3]